MLNINNKHISKFDIKKHLDVTNSLVNNLKIMSTNKMNSISLVISMISTKRSHNCEENVKQVF